MKAALVLFVVCSAFLAANALPAAEDATAPTKGPMSWFNPVAYEYMMCRMQCKQSCADQGYWRGYCKEGECFCYGMLGTTFPQMKGVAMPMY